MEALTKEERDKKYQEYTNEALFTGHYHFLVQALAVAMQSTMVWRLMGTNDAFTFVDLFEFAKKRDEEDPLDEYQFYMVTSEGAIGLSAGLEYLTEWIFIPMEPCEERERLLEEMGEKLQLQAAAREAVDKAVEEGLAEQQRQQQAQQQPQPPAQALPKYLVLFGDKYEGPFSVDEMRTMNLTLETYVWTEGMEQWKMVGQLEELPIALGLVQPTVPPLPPLYPQQPSGYPNDPNAPNN